MNLFASFYYDLAFMEFWLQNIIPHVLPWHSHLFRSFRNSWCYHHRFALLMMSYVVMLLAVALLSNKNLNAYIRRMWRWKTTWSAWADHHKAKSELDLLYDSWYSNLEYFHTASLCRCHFTCIRFARWNKCLGPGESWTCHPWIDRPTL
jgi:hypothetical protein